MLAENILFCPVGAKLVRISLHRQYFNRVIIRDVEWVPAILPDAC